MNDIFKKSAAILFAVCLLIPMLAFAASAEDVTGTCGESISWSLSGYSLTIDGTGAMTDFDEADMAPWYDYRDDIRSVTVSDGVTSVGNLAFYNLGELTSISLPGTVERVGDFSFAKCVRLENITDITGIKTIGESAFEECEALVAFNFPDGLTTIDTRAFYRCYSLITVIIPASVTEMGVSTFAYCSGLLSATVRANITVLPTWTFYGCSAVTKIVLPITVTSIGEYNFINCDNLSAICYGGDYDTSVKLVEDIKATEPEFNDATFINASDYTGEIHSSVTTESGEKTNTSVTTVKETDNSTIATTVTTTVPVTSQSETIPENVEIRTATLITGVVKGVEGWREIVEEIIEVDKKRNEDDTDPVEVNITLTGSAEVTEEVLTQLSDTNTSVNITTSDGTKISLVSKDINTKKLSKSYDLTCSVKANTAPTEKQKEVFGETTVFDLQINDDINFNYSPRVYLGRKYANQTATLYQNDADKGPQRMQSASVDSAGYATFHLSSTNKLTGYTIAMNVNGESENALVPTSDASSYGNIQNEQQIEYVVSEVRTPFGLSVKQFTWIVGGVLGFFVIIIGVVMFLLNKFRMKFPIKAKKKESTAQH